MTFGAAGDTTVVRTFPYGVPEGADSLVRLSFGADDTVRHVPGRLLPTDSLPEPIDTVLPADPVSAADIYGPVSFVPVAGAPEPCGIPVTFGVGYQMLTVLLLLLYLLLVFRAGGHAARMMRAVWGRGGEGKHRHDGDMPGAEVQALILACGLLMCGLAAVKIFELWGEWRWLPSSLWGGGWLAVPAVMLALLAVMGVQSAVLHVVGKLTFSTEFIRMLCAKRLSLFASMTVTGTPAVLLAALSGGVWADVAGRLVCGRNRRSLSALCRTLLFVVYRPKSFDFALDFVPLRRRSDAVRHICGRPVQELAGIDAVELKQV